MNKRRSAFTFVELLVVLTLLGIAILFIIPSASRKIINSNNLEKFFNEKLREAYTEAKDTGQPVYIRGIIGSPNITLYDNKTVGLPQSINILRVKVNDEKVNGLKYQIGIYPAGICDYFELETDKGYKIMSIPLLLKTEKVL